ncbi:MAG: hypothetical protein M3N98_12160 [Actinomycetota bacterium]|nr:hypothetical protein [Actinomycetota bacterium]
MLMVVVLGLEVGSQLLLTPPHKSDRAAQVFKLPGAAALTNGIQVDRTEVADQVIAHAQPPGLAIGDLALLDGLLLVMVAIAGLSLRRSPPPAAGSALGPASLTASMIAALAGIFLVDVALSRLRAEVALYLSPPFGTLMYLALFGFFRREGSLFVLGALIVLKLAVSILVSRADPRFGQHRSVSGLLITSVVATIAVSLLYGIVPPTMVSTTDAIAALAVTVAGLIWALGLLIGSMTSVARGLRFDTAVPARSEV